MSTRAIQKLTQLIHNLEDAGDPLRLFAAQSAYNFKHSWIEMADALVQVRSSGSFKQWGYDDFISYCDAELGLKKALVDKLTVSFSALEQYAPERLSAEAEAPIPTYQSLDYFSRAMGEPRLDGTDPKDAPQEPLSPELSGQLFTAVFEEGCTHKQLRDRFDPIIRPKSSAEEQHDAVKKVLSTTKKLQEQLESLENLDAALLRESLTILARLQSVMEDQKETLGLALTGEPAADGDRLIPSS